MVLGRDVWGLRIDGNCITTCSAFFFLGFSGALDPDVGCALVFVTFLFLFFVTFLWVLYSGGGPVFQGMDSWTARHSDKKLIRPVSRPADPFRFYGLGGILCLCTVRAGACL